MYHTKTAQYAQYTPRITAFLARAGPRPVTFEAEFNYYVEGLSGMYGDENCPALTSACESRVAKYSANQSAVCDTLAGCVFTRDNICAGCSTLTDKNKGSALCQANHQCVFIKPDNDGNPVSTVDSTPS